jgi:hypothetical protein
MHNGHTLLKFVSNSSMTGVEALASNAAAAPYSIRKMGGFVFAPLARCGLVRLRHGYAKPFLLLFSSLLEPRLGAITVTSPNSLGVDLRVQLVHCFFEHVATNSVRLVVLCRELRRGMVASPRPCPTGRRRAGCAIGLLLLQILVCCRGRALLPSAASFLWSSWSEARSCGLTGQRPAA